MVGEAQFMIKNKGNSDMKDVFIRVKLDSKESYTSDKVDIPTGAQEVIKVEIPDRLYHQSYEVNYSESGESVLSDFGDFTLTVPVSQSFIINKKLDTISIDTFYVIKEELTKSEKEQFGLNFKKGNTYLENEHYDSALFFYKAAMQIDPTSPDLNFNLTILNSYLSQYKRALYHIDIAITHGGARWQYLNSQCYLLGKLGNCKQAIPVGIESLNLNPDNIRVYGNLIKCFDQLQKGDSVLKYTTVVKQKFGKLSGWMNETRNRYSK